MYKIWAESIAASIQAESKTAAGLISHPGRRGSEREGIVRATLARILPGDVEIGTGHVFDSKGRESKQIDVVVARKSFPIIRFNDGSCNYPIESVIATIEVKSDLDAATLRAGIENCRSVSDLEPGLHISSLATLQQVYGVSFDSNNQPIGDPHAVRKFQFGSKPATYVIGYQGQPNLWSPFCTWYQSQTSRLVWSVPSMIISFSDREEANNPEYNFVMRNDDAILLSSRCPHAMAGYTDKPLVLFIVHMLKTIFRSCPTPATSDGFIYSARAHISDATFAAKSGIGELLSPEP